MLSCLNIHPHTMHLRKGKKFGWFPLLVSRINPSAKVKNERSDSKHVWPAADGVRENCLSEAAFFKKKKKFLKAGFLIIIAFALLSGFPQTGKPKNTFNFVPMHVKMYVPTWLHLQQNRNIASQVALNSRLVRNAHASGVSKSWSTWQWNRSFLWVVPS